MQEYQKEFIRFCLDAGALKFGEFILKSGRQSPYFFNAGMFKDGNSFLQLAKFYAMAITENFKDSEFDLLFGPAYKGITLATVASMGLAQMGKRVPVCFNRKEKKDHGEGGVMIGEPLKGKRALLIDDVITAGTTIREAVEITNAEHGSLAGIVIALNRQEIGLNSKLSAIQEVENTYHLKVISIITMEHLIEYVHNNDKLSSHLEALNNYRKIYGVV